VVKDTLNAHTARIEELKLLLADVQEAPVLLHPHMGMHYRKEVEMLIASLNNPDHRHEAAEMIRSLIEKITLTPKPEGGLTIDLHGDLAGILTIAAGTNGSDTKELANQIRSITEPHNAEDSTPSNQQNSLRAAISNTQTIPQQDLLVAGAGFEPAAFRL
jgi:site-specific DNA recombinase